MKCYLVYSNDVSNNRVSNDRLVAGPRKVYISSFEAAQNLENLRQLNIGIIVNCTYNGQCSYKKEFEFLRIPMSDDGSEDISAVMHKGADFIQFAGNGKNVLVHCQLGISRSVTIVIAWMVKYARLSVCDALKQIRVSHPRADPNMGFLQQLVEYEEQITGLKSCRLVENCKLCLKLKFADELLTFTSCRHSLCKTCNLKETNVGMCPHCGFEAQQRLREEQRFTKEEKSDSDLNCAVTDIKHRVYSIC